MKYLLSIFLFLILACFSYADDQARIDYFFIFNGGMFIHDDGKAIEDFRHFTLPETKTYSDKIQIADVTPDGDMVCVLRGIKDEDDKIDLVRITSDMKIIPLFSILKREELDNGRKKDRTFGDVDYDISNEKTVFTVIERTSQKPGVAETNVEYLSGLYQIPVNGGACILVNEYNGIIEDICAGGGKIGIVEKVTSGGEEKTDLYISTTAEQTGFNLLQITSGSVVSADLSPDGKELLVVEKISSGSKPYKLSRILLDGKGGIEKTLIKEWGEDAMEIGHRYSIDGKHILFSQNRLMHWGENRITFIMSDAESYPLVRDDFASQYKPVNKPKNAGEIERITITPRITSGNKEEKTTYTIAGTKVDSAPAFLRTDENGNGFLLNDKLEKIDEFQSGEFENAIKGIFIDNDKWVALTELTLGERLISFETIKYGNVYEKVIGGEPVNHDLHLAWNIGGHLVGLRIPDKEIFIGGDKNYIHMILHYPFKANYPVTKFITPFYRLNRESWMIERSYDFGDYKTESHYFVRSASDDSGNLYLLDSLNSRILKYDINLKQSEIGWLPDNIPPLALPSDMLIKGDKIWVNDPLNQRIVIFTLDGAPIKEIDLDIPSGSSDCSRFLYIDDKGFSLINLDNLNITEIGMP